MIDKYFGFTTINDEASIIDSLVEHTRIDGEELFLLRDMVTELSIHDHSQLESFHYKIAKIQQDSTRIFEHTEDQIIQAHFDYQKQYDLLRIYQRIESVSSGILNCSERILIISRINGKLPHECVHQLQVLIEMVIKNHNNFKQAFIDYNTCKKDVIGTIHKIVEQEKMINDHYYRCVETLYLLANEDKLLLGHFRSLEKLFGSLEFLGNRIEKAATSLEWLLIY